MGPIHGSESRAMKTSMIKRLITSDGNLRTASDVVILECAGVAARIDSGGRMCIMYDGSMSVYEMTDNGPDVRQATEREMADFQTAFDKQ